MNEEIKNILIEKMDKESGCPICSLIIDYEFNTLSKLQYEITNNEEVREEIASEGGFCDFHFRQFRKIANGKTNIIFIKTILEKSDFENNFKTNCRICNSVNNFERELIETEYELLNNKEFQDKFQNTLGICFPHLNNIISRCTENFAHWLIQINAEQFKRNLNDFEIMSNVKSYYEIDMGKRRLINVIIEKIAGRKIGGL